MKREGGAKAFRGELVGESGLREPETRCKEKNYKPGFAKVIPK